MKPQIGMNSKRRVRQLSRSRRGLWQPEQCGFEPRRGRTSISMVLVASISRASS